MSDPTPQPLLIRDRARQAAQDTEEHRAFEDALSAWSWASQEQIDAAQIIHEATTALARILRIHPENLGPWAVQDSTRQRATITLDGVTFAWNHGYTYLLVPCSHEGCAEHAKHRQVSNLSEVNAALAEDGVCAEHNPTTAEAPF